MTVPQPKFPREHPFYAFTDRRSLLISVVCLSVALLVAGQLGDSDDTYALESLRMFQSP